MGPAGNGAHQDLGASADPYRAVTLLSARLSLRWVGFFSPVNPSFSRDPPISEMKGTSPSRGPAPQHCSSRDKALFCQT